MKKVSPFRFKQFILHHDRCAMKVGTDAVVLGAWTNVDGARRILDVGTGCGILALMLAQRTPTTIRMDAVEIAYPDFIQAAENVNRSPWPEKIKVHHSSIQDFATRTSYDLIVCNPPFFVDSLLPPSASRKQARHSGSLSYPDLLSAVKQRLSPGGILSIVLPTAEGIMFQSLAEESGLSCSRRLAFFSRKEKPQERWFMEFCFGKKPVTNSTLVLHDEGDKWSEEYRGLTWDFYLNK